MNRKDFIKTLIAGVVTVPVITKASLKEATASSVINPDVDAIFIECKSAAITPEYNNGLGGTISGIPKLMLTGKKIRLNGINKLEFNSLVDVMGKYQTERTFLIGGFKSKILITGIMTHLDYNVFSDDVTCEIRYTRP